MTTPKTTTKTSSKSTTKATTKTKPKTKPKSKPEKLDLDAFTVTQTELGYILGIATANISPMVQAGVMTKDADGRFNLRDAVSGYCKRMRDRKEGNGKSKTDLELEHIALKNEKLREQLRSWRMQRDREVGLAIIQSLRTTMNQLKDECKLVPAICEVIDGFIDAIEKVDITEISYEIEGENDDDDAE